MLKGEGNLVYTMNSLEFVYDHNGTDAWTVCIEGVNAGGEIKD